VKIRHLVIERFRGIERLDWHLEANFYCLIGSGDSRKSTVLDAIDLALGARSRIDFDDSDFFQLKTDDPFQITASLTGFPADLMDEKRFGLFLTGYKSGECHDEMGEGDEPMLTVRLQVDKSLEAEWAVVNGQHPDGRFISAKDRDKLGVMRLGGFVNQHLTWRKGTALSKLTGGADDIDGILAEASRSARQNIPAKALVNFQAAAKKAEELGRALGVLPQSKYEANLDAAAINVGEAGFTLHDGQVPIRRIGLGARRLLIMALQSEIAAAGGIILIDEFEHGLEPHRVRHLLRQFERQAAQQSFGQVFLTSHSPVVLEECPKRIHVVRSSGSVEIRRVPDELVASVRKAPEAFLGRKVLVCEGKTEVGICRAYDELEVANEQESFASGGIVPVEGGGTEAVRISEDFAQLGYDVLYLGDSDRPDTEEKKAEMQKVGINVEVWEGGVSLEERVFTDLPWEGVLESLRLVAGDKGDDAVVSQVATRLGKRPTELGQIADWTESSDLRKIIGVAAKKNGWYKRIDMGESLGRIVLKHLADMQSKDVANKLQAIREWAT
jgi:putative ATP-dependent endonuclease of the OLD family